MSNIIEWLFNGRVGLSSKAMAAVALGVTIRDRRDRVFHPLDAGDFYRCLGLVKTCPEVREHFPSIAQLSSEWRGIIEHWSEIERSFYSEVGTSWDNGSYGPNADKTYHLIQRILRESKEGASDA